MNFSGDWCPLCQVLAQDAAKRWQGGLWSPLSWVLLRLPLYICYPQHHILHLSLRLPWTLQPSKAKPPRCFLHSWSPAQEVPPHLSELEDASCADVLGRGHFHRAVLPVLIQLQDLNPQLHFAGHLTPPAQQIIHWLGSLVCLVFWVFFSPKEKGMKTSKHWAQSAGWSSNNHCNKCTICEHSGSSCEVLLNFPDGCFSQTSEISLFLIPIQAPISHLSSGLNSCHRSLVLSGQSDWDGRQKNEIRHCLTSSQDSEHFPDLLHITAFSPTLSRA